MCEPNPTTFSRISFLKPVRMATESIITARPLAMPIMAITFIGLENDVPSILPLIRRCAMKYGRFI